MKIILSPQRRDDTLIVVKIGDSLVINDVEYDFGQLPDGGILPHEAIDCEWISSDVVRVGGKIELTLFIPNTADASDAARFPEPIVNPADGELVLPR